jgi:hypothetical protein
MACAAALDGIQLAVAFVGAVDGDINLVELVHVPKDEVGGNDELFRLEPYSEGISVSKPLKEEDEEMMNEGIPDKGIMEDGIVEV